MRRSCACASPARDTAPLQWPVSTDSLGYIVSKPLLASALCALFVSSGLACKPKIPTIDAPFTDTFERAALGADWFDTSQEARIKEGKFLLANAYNHPVWLKRKLPHDVQIDFDAMSKSPSGDIKVELFGDGESFDPDRGRYDPTSYMFVMGGWNNSRSIIGRLGEHEEAVKAFRDRHGAEPLVVPGRSYHFTITRRGGMLEWKIDGAPYLSWNDPQPLTGPDHAYFAINDWEADVRFDNLTIRPLP
jgi:hypothetical protein